MIGRFLKFMLAAVLVASGVAKAAETKLSLTMDKVPAQQLVMLYYDQCEKRGLVFDPTVSKLDDVLTVKTTVMTCREIKSILLDALDRAGVSIENRVNYDVITQAAKREETDGWQELIYRPRFRDALELAQQTMIVIRKGVYAHQRRGASVQLTTPGQTSVPETMSNGASITAKAIDKLIFYGPAAESKAVETLLLKLDVPVPQVEISAGIYEYQGGRSEASAVNAAMKLFGAKLGISISGGNTSGSTLKLSVPDLDAALSLLDADSRFHYVARPKALVRDGEQVSFVSGQDVRVTGSVTTNGTGQSVQSITTLTAGVSMQVSPLIRGDIVDVTFHQTVSDFVASPNADPSIMKRELTSKLVMRPGLVYIIGGLQTSRKTQNRQTFFGFPVGSSADAADTEILLLLAVKLDQEGVGDVP
jgi:type II secretory pathway component GspD/PulD (secretin)